MESYTITVNVTAPRGVHVAVNVKVLPGPAVVNRTVRRRGPEPAVVARPPGPQVRRAATRVCSTMDAATRAHLLAAPKASRVRDMSLELSGRRKISGLEDRLRGALNSDEDE